MLKKMCPLRSNTMRSPKWLGPSRYSSVGALKMSCTSTKALPFSLPRTIFVIALPFGPGSLNDR